MSDAYKDLAASYERLECEHLSECDRLERGLAEAMEIIDHITSGMEWALPYDFDDHAALIARITALKERAKT